MDGLVIICRIHILFIMSRFPFYFNPMDSFFFSIEGKSYGDEGLLLRLDRFRHFQLILRDRGAVRPRLFPRGQNTVCILRLQSKALRRIRGTSSRLHWGKRSRKNHWTYRVQTSGQSSMTIKATHSVEHPTKGRAVEMEERRRIKLHLHGLGTDGCVRFERMRCCGKNRRKKQLTPTVLYARTRNR